MIIRVKVSAAASRDAIKLQDDGSYKVWVKAPPFRGYANKSALELIAKHFKTSVSKLSITQGRTSPYKTISIDK